MTSGFRLTVIAGSVSESTRHGDHGGTIMPQLSLTARCGYWVVKYSHGKIPTTSGVRLTVIAGSVSLQPQIGSQEVDIP